jgi:hypothetical protein
MATVSNLKSVTAAMAALFQDTEFRRRLEMQMLVIARYHRDNAGSSYRAKSLAAAMLGPMLVGGVLHVFLQLAVSDSTIKNAAISGTAPDITMDESDILDAHLDTFVGALWEPAAELLGIPAAAPNP